MEKDIEFKQRKITIETPCHLHELEHLIQMVGNEGYWDTAKIITEENKIAIIYGEEND